MNLFFTRDYICKIQKFLKYYPCFMIFYKKKNNYKYLKFINLLLHIYIIINLYTICHFKLSQRIAFKVHKSLKYFM